MRACLRLVAAITISTVLGLAARRSAASSRAFSTRRLSRASQGMTQSRPYFKPGRSPVLSVAVQTLAVVRRRDGLAHRQLVGCMLLDVLLGKVCYVRHCVLR